MVSVSIIIPTLNEAENIGPLLRYLTQLEPEAEFIVSDANSTDGTADRGRQMARIVPAPQGRGAQMNVGAKVATGDILWFIHADCRPHPDSFRALRSALEDASVVGGGFIYGLDHEGLRYRLTETLSNWKNRLLKLLYGDMGIFVRRTVFETMGGFKEIPLMEDMEFSRHLKQHGKIVILPLCMNTSARRWIEEGWLRNSVRSWLLQSAWVLGVSPHTLAKWYRFK